MKKILPLLIAVTAVAALFFSAPKKAEAATYSGSCGANTTWNLNTSTGVLTISGNGAMANFSIGYDTTIGANKTSAPWFQYRTSIKSVVIGEGITNVGNCAFAGCGQTTVKIAKTVTTLGNYSFYASPLTSITVPGNVATIGDYAFYNCQRMTKVVLENGVKSIGKYSFGNCTSLATISIPSSTMTIGNGAFYEDSSLYGVFLPKGITTIGAKAFMGCSSLSEIVIPDSCSTLEGEAFKNCISLEKATIGENVENIYGGVFTGCFALKEISIPGHFTSGFSDPDFSNCPLKKVVFNNGSPYIVSSVVKSFQDTVEEIVLSDAITTININAFSGCKNLKSVYYNTKVSKKNSITINTGNEPLKSAQWICSILDSISVEKTPNKTSYYVNDKFDSKGLQIRANYKDGSFETLTSGFAVGAVSTTSVGKKQVKVGLDGKETSFSITVLRAGMTSLTGDLDMDGDINDWDGVLMDRYLAGWNVSVDELALDIDGDGEISDWDGVILDRYLAGWNVEIAGSAKQIRSISVKTMPAKTQYKVGETLDTSGLVLSITFSDGTTGTATSGFTATLPSGANQTSGKKTVTVTYNKATTTFEVTFSGNSSSLNSDVDRVEMGSAITWIDPLNVGAIPDYIVYFKDGTVEKSVDNGDAIYHGGKFYWMNLSRDTLADMEKWQIGGTYTAKAEFIMAGAIVSTYSFQVTVQGCTAISISGNQNLSIVLTKSNGSKETIQAVEYFPGAGDASFSSGTLSTSRTDLGRLFVQFNFGDQNEPVFCRKVTLVIGNLTSNELAECQWVRMQIAQKIGLPPEE